MSKHIDRMKRAIEFGNPDIIPMELVDVPYLYNAYDTMKAEEVVLPEGTEDFDSAWCTYHWTFNYHGKNDNGELLRRDEWGCEQVIPHDRGGAYNVIEKPMLSSIEEVDSYQWPTPGITDWFFESRKKIIQEYYSDRFICGFLDPGAFLVAFNIFGYDGLLLNIFDNLDLIKNVIRRIFDYQIALVPKFKEMGAHMVNIIDELAGTNGMMFSPDIWREHFKPMYDELLDVIHKNNMYTSILLDGNIAEIMPDLMQMNLDQQFFAQPHSTGIDVISEYCRGKRCVKMAVDMMETLANGTPEQITADVDDMVEKLNTQSGGLIFQTLRWRRPEYDPVRVKAQIDAMNQYRSEKVEVRME